MILNNNIIRLFSGKHSNGNQFVFALSSASSKYTTALVHRKAISSTHPPLRFQCDFDLRLCRCLLINYASPCCGKFFVIPSLFSTTVNSTTSRDSPMHFFFTFSPTTYILRYCFRFMLLSFVCRIFKYYCFSSGQGSNEYGLTHQVLQ